MQAIVHAEINLTALLHNARIIKKLAPQAKILAMVKANAYGHGASLIAKTLAPIVDGFGVARLTEAIFLQKQNIHHPIFILNGFSTKEELIEIAKYNFIIAIQNLQQVELIEKTDLPKPISAWIKINTGMNRLGIQRQFFSEAYQRLSNCKNILKPIGLMTHFACADDKENPMNQLQNELFLNLTQSIFAEKSLANSAAILNFPHTHANWIRPGIMLYGCSPIANKTGIDLNLKPVMTLKSKIIVIADIEKGMSIGYGATFIAAKDMRIGVIAIGYGDGYPRHIKSETPVLINKKFAYIVGRVSMDSIVVDLNNHPEAQINDEAILWGEGLPVEIIAEKAHTICYELLCQVSHIPERVYFGEKT